jgi:hypothetical protein
MSLAIAVVCDQGDLFSRCLRTTYLGEPSSRVAFIPHKSFDRASPDSPVMSLKTILFLDFILRFLYPQISVLAQRLATNEEWWHSACRGGRLVQAMVWSPPHANEFLDPISSPWDGTMHRELAQWGYSESEKPQLCELDTYWGLGSVFRSLGIDPRSNFNHGPNRCFHVSHGNPMLKRPDGRAWPLSEQIYIAPDGWKNRVSLSCLSSSSCY